MVVAEVVAGVVVFDTAESLVTIDEVVDAVVDVLSNSEVEKDVD